MRTTPFKPASPVLPSHLAAACIYARPNHQHSPRVQPADGILAELAAMPSAR